MWCETTIEFTELAKFNVTLRLHGMPWGVKPTCFKAPGVSLGGSGVSIGGVRILRVDTKNRWFGKENSSKIR